MVTTSWGQYEQHAWRVMRGAVHDGADLQVEYTEVPAFLPEAWLIAVHLVAGQHRLSVCRWNQSPILEDLKTTGVTSSEPMLRTWNRFMSPKEVEEFKEVTAFLRANPEGRDGITLDGMTCAVLLQEVEPVLMLDWNGVNGTAAQSRFQDWTEVIRLRRFMRG